MLRKKSVILAMKATNELSILTGKSPIYSRLLSGGAWALGGKVVIVPLGLVINALLARLLDPADMGTYIFTLSIVATAAVIAQLGLGPAATRLIAQSKGIGDLQTVREIVYETTKWAVLGLVGVGTVLALIGQRLGIREDLIFLTVLWVAILTGFQLLGEMLRGFHDIRTTVLISASSTTGGVLPHVFIAVPLLLLWAAYSKISLQLAVVVMIMGGGIGIAWGSFTLLKRIRELLHSASLDEVRSSMPILPIALPILTSMMMTLVWNQAGIWILAAHSSPENVALYGSARRLVLLMSVALAVANSVLPPLIAELYAQQETYKLERLLRRTAMAASLPALIGLGLFTIAGDTILAIVYGDFYRSGQDVLLLFMIGNAAQVFTGSCGIVLNMTGYQNELTVATLVTSILAIGCAMLLVKPFGMLGVALAISIGEVLQNIVKMLLTKHLVGVWTYAGF